MSEGSAGPSVHLVPPSPQQFCRNATLWRRQPLILPVAAVCISPPAQAETLNPLGPCWLFLLAPEQSGLTLERGWSAPAMAEGSMS